ncbi:MULTISPECIES: hypothetical protein [Alphaproteobacteria]|uniref:Uncharacterized protein n=2 Tax=Alphaproteobacteria TaxID=28211 RepID=A0A512HDC7_9HYPH|nr:MULTISPECIES: hypothetical protein [Alphaproteobacteria]GEO83457.1 hypothetical protein RNA01_03890 [Ciceribacter naphthalenivorans]GLR24393.1 hypothetical protein GCM10007920_41870 [Ciceribacter naphthalenivorans]GLT07249.1 hypothetical protein GCM10007926_41870 [Sphingomonas psychrolutea]
MKKCPYTTQRERIVAEAISPVATELRLLDAADLISMLRFELYGNIADLVSSAAELYFHPGTVIFGAGGEYRLDWGGVPEVVLDLEIKPKDITIYAQLSLADEHAGVEINHIAFQQPSGDPDENTRLLERRLREARFVKSPSDSLYM